eukprot:8935839-Pyramimonas_sp.AAC.1
MPSCPAAFGGAPHQTEALSDSARHSPTPQRAKARLRIVCATRLRQMARFIEAAARARRVAGMRRHCADRGGPAD